jgi:alpha-glucosidase (family GH31 glycosyl hydrolase)
MQDYGEYVDPYQRFANGWRGEQMHNEYPNLYHEASFNFFKNLSDPKRFARGYAPDYLYYVRSGYSKTQHNVWATWTGDPCSDFSRYCGLPAQLSAMLSVGLSGLAYTGSDTGGFVWLSPPSLTLWVRWLQLSSVSAIMEIDGGGTAILGAEKSHLF